MLESQIRVFFYRYYFIIISFPSTGIYFYWTDISMIHLCGRNHATRESYWLDTCGHSVENTLPNSQGWLHFPSGEINLEIISNGKL